MPTDDDGRVRGFVEKPPRDEAPTNWINAGTYVLEPSVLDRIPGGRKVSIERETFPALVADRSLYALQSDAYWVDAGTPATYLEVQLDLLDGKRGDARAGIDSRTSIASDGQGASIGDRFGHHDRRRRRDRRLVHHERRPNQCASSRPRLDRRGGGYHRGRRFAHCVVCHR